MLGRIDDAMQLQQLADLYEHLTPEHRDDLLQGILIAASISSEQVQKVIDASLFLHLVERDLEAL